MIYPISQLLITRILLIAGLFTLGDALSFQNVTQPSLKYSSFGDRIGFFGSFAASSFYSHIGSSDSLSLPLSSSLSSSSSSSSSSNSQGSDNNAKRDDDGDDGSESSTNNSNLYLQDNGSGSSLKFGQVNGEIKQILRISDDEIVINGDFDSFNGESIKSPFIYNITSNSTTTIISDSDKLNGTVNTVLVDDNLIYLGGNFTFNSTVGVAIYNTSSSKLQSALFQGFGENATINTITKIVASGDEKDSDSQGSIIFGGKFDTLGLADLLVHNITTNSTKNHNSSNSSIVSAEQLIPLRHGVFTSVNGADNADNSLVICPSDSNEWAATAGSGAEWKVELPDEMKGIVPTKARIYIPDSSDGVKLFRIYTFPNNGIMNLTYIDPSTNEVAHCDAWCPLTAFDDLNEYVDRNRDNATDLNEDDVFVDEEDGTFFKYYDPDTMTKNLGYGSNFQEFAFVNEVGIDSVGLTILEWYGDQGVFSGFELYQDAITVYGNNTLNEPNCDDEFSKENNNYAEIVAGDFQSAKSVYSQVTNTDYLVTFDTDAKIVLYPNISYSGDYSIIMNTPGCATDNTCSQRSIVNVTFIDGNNSVLSTDLIYQNNENYKFDYLYYGHLTAGDHANRIEVSYHDSINADTANPMMVVDKVVADIVSLDSYYERNSTNNTKSNLRSYLTYTELNGLFEYSLANFTDFDENLVHYKVNNKTLISLNNTFVGNSSINVLSGRFSNNSEINEIIVTGTNANDQNYLKILGNFESDSKNLTLTNNNIVTLNISSYNSTLNETNINLPTSLKRKSKRDTQTISGVSFNDTIVKIASVGAGVVYIGQFSATGSDEFKDMSNRNESTSQANNFALLVNNQWYSFGNDFVDASFDQFTNATIDGTEYYIFSAQGTIFKTWDNSNFTWSDRQLNLTQATQLSSTQQILGGSGFNIMDIYSQDQAYIQNAKFDKFGMNVEVSGGNGSSFISESFYVNDTLSIVAGNFVSGDVEKIGLLNNSDPTNSITILSEDIKWDNDTVIETLYVDSTGDYLFIGVNGSVEINNDNVTGIVIYDLVNNTFMSIQPAALSNSNGDPIHINSVVLYDDDDKLLVGGDFDTAGSLSCPSLCVYDLVNTRWINPQSDAEQSTSVSGVVTDMKFYSSNRVLIAGTNLTLSNKDVTFMTYNFNNGAFDTKSSLNKLNKGVNRFILNDRSNSDLSGRMIALGNDYIAGFDGENWSNIDSGVDYDTNFYTFNDMKLLTLQKSTSYNQTYFDDDKILLVAGTFTLDEYGLVNMALFNGTSWIPYVYTTSVGDESQIGDIQTILINDAYRFQSSDDLKNLNKYLSKGKVVGISLACALGSTALLGLLYIIPYFALLKNRKGYVQRIHESDMMQAVNPEDLLHEIDLQREK